MSNGFWNEDEGDFRDNPVELSEGQWKPNQADFVQSAPARSPRHAQQVQQQIEQVVDEIDLTLDDEEDFTAVLSDARLRLEQGKLYEIIMNQDLFSGTDSDGRAVKNVQREIRKFARERMEIMLGMRQDTKTENVVKSQFNELEVEVLKSLASRATKGATEIQTPKPVQVEKKITLNTIKPTPKPTQGATVNSQIPLKTAPKVPVARTKSAQTAPVSTREEDYKPLDKDPSQMSFEEIEQRNKEASQRQAKRKAKIPKDRKPMPTYEQEYAMAQEHASLGGNSPAVTRLVDTINLLNKR